MACQIRIYNDRSPMTTNNLYSKPQFKNLKDDMKPVNPRICISQSGDFQSQGCTAPINQ